MTAIPSPDSLAGLVQVGAFTVFVPRFEELIATATRMQLFFIHSRRWRENHDSAIKAFLARPDTSLEVFLPDLENHELLYSLEKHFDDGPLIPALVADAYRYFSRLGRDSRRVEIWLFGRYPTYSFYGFDERAIIALYSNSTAKKELPAFEIQRDGFFGRFLAEDIEDLKRECRKRAPEEIAALFGNTGSYQTGTSY
ncbi:MAG TPA: hypothetical protein VEB59_04745 [Gemmatimonadales bacterium]|nr:hypothetical protein [Gemmatimonadales bacterium]